MEGAEDAVADDVAQLVIGHPPVQAKRGDDVKVVDARLSGHVDDLFHHELAYIGRGHGRQWQREVVERDRQLHPASQQRLQRIVLQRLGQRPLDRTFRMRDRLERVRRIDDARSERHLFQPDAFPEVKEHRRRVAIDFNHRARSRHQILNRRRSNATFTAPRRPALIAYSIASRYSPRPKSGPVSSSRFSDGEASSARSNVLRALRFGSVP